MQVLQTTTLKTSSGLSFESPARPTRRKARAGFSFVGLTLQRHSPPYTACILRA